MGSIIKNCSSLFRSNLLQSKYKAPVDILRGYIPRRQPTKRIPPWLPKQTRVLNDTQLSSENTKFVSEIIESKYGTADPVSGCYSPLKVAPIEPNSHWSPTSRRTGVIGRKIGIYPFWLKNGKKVSSTLFQICDNHVIKYIPPDEWQPIIRTKHILTKRKLGCLVVGADSADPQLFTKEYCGIFAESGVMPKRILTRFAVSPDAALQPGTPLMAAHFRPGEVVDIRAKTIDRGFQGVCKRWGFKGMPASHGVTKTHRRPGNIGSGGNKARVMPGQKLPGHMGNRYRVFRGIKILRVNTKYNVIWVLGQAIPGETNSYCYIYDTLLTARKFKEPPNFPTYIPDDEPLPEDLLLDEVHPWDAPSFALEPEK